MTVIVYMHACYCSIHIQMIFSILPNPFMKSHLEGSQTTIYCAVSEEMEGVSGKYYQIAETKVSRLQPRVMKIWNDSGSLATSWLILKSKN